MADSTPLHDVLSSLLARAQQGAIAASQQFPDQPAIAAAQAAVQAGRVDLFERALARPLAQVVEGVLHQELMHNYRAQFLFQHSRFVEQHLRAVIEKVEGRACCADKTRTVLRALAGHLVHGTPIAFDYAQEYTFHLPTTVLREHTDVVAFFDALVELYYGKPAPYLAWQASLPPGAR